eukprot:3215983-Alexandrium_andersonii.AAC.1
MVEQGQLIAHVLFDFALGVSGGLRPPDPPRLARGVLSPPPQGVGTVRARIPSSRSWSSTGRITALTS